MSDIGPAEGKEIVGAFVDSALDQHDHTGSTFIDEGRRAELAARLGMDPDMVDVRAHIAGLLARAELTQLELDLMDCEVEGGYGE